MATYHQTDIIMTYHDQLQQKSSFELYKMVANFLRNDGELSAADLKLHQLIGETASEDESFKTELVDLVERIHDDNLFPVDRDDRKAMTNKFLSNISDWDSDATVNVIEGLLSMLSDAQFKAYINSQKT